MRDEQEPALLLWEPGQISFEQAGDLLEWSPRVLVHHQALSEALTWGIKLDAVWSAPEAMADVAAAVAHQQPVSVLPLQENRALQAVLHWLKEKQQTSIYLIAAAEADNYQLLQRLIPDQSLIQLQVISQGWRYSFFKSGQTKKWLPQDSLIRIISFDEPVKLSGIVLTPVNQNQPLLEIALQESGILTVAGAAAFWLGEQL